MRLIDTHCHLNDSEAFPDASAEIALAREAGVERVIVVGVDTDSSRRAVELADAHEGAYAIVGWHPNYTAAYTPGELRHVEDMLAHPKAVAVGEIGLDFHWTHASLDQQEKALLDQLALAESVGKPVVFHCREAYRALLDILEQRRALPYLFHCFAGDREDARRATAIDAHFGVDGPITYKKADDLREIVRMLPRERLVVETDAPYLSPVPYRGKANRPAYVRHVNAGLAAALGISEEESASVTTANAERFFGI